ncbi:unnamed protein product [Ilex paraguariensis]|uniref:Uncharacterized protein n=1 Tax=Ilex paraguariensis TaxID=185542 RepID=A0ABC8QQV5_9AQUA
MWYCPIEGSWRLCLQLERVGTPSPHKTSSRLAVVVLKHGQLNTDVFMHTHCWKGLWIRSWSPHSLVADKMSKEEGSDLLRRRRRQSKLQIFKSSPAQTKTIKASNLQA